MKSPNQIGREAELKVQKILWQRNYRVKDVSRMNLGFDLLVNDKYKVEVKSMNGNSTTIKLDENNFDILSIVFMTKIQSQVFFLKDKKYLKEMSYGEHVYLINVETIKKYFTKKPKEIFN